jgi:protein-S-isoprenylcysteine O-methyltransferase Ste14
VIAEFDIAGILISSVLVSALAALAIGFVLRRLLVWTGAYRFVWHPALFDTAAFFILWAALIAAPLLSPL